MDVCPTCDEEFEKIGSHWHLSECEYPKLDSRQHDVVTGTVMGDGCIGATDGQKPRLVVSNIHAEYLEYISDVLGVYSNKVMMYRSAAESAKRSRDTGFNDDASDLDYSDIYRLYSTRSPVFDTFRQWYNTGEKVFPKDVTLSPTVLKHWFCCDGSGGYNDGSHYIRISMCNESENIDKIESYFDDIGIPVSWWEKRTRPDGGDFCSARFGVEESAELIEYMGDPLPGFCYKWPDNYGPSDTVTA